MKVLKIRNPILLWLMVLLPFTIPAQTNLVPNGNFDSRVDNTPCQTNFCAKNGYGYNKLLDYWSKVDYWTIPKKKVSILSPPKVGTPDYFCNYGLPGSESGNGHQFPGEYHVVKTSSTLSSGNYYYWEIWIQSRANNGDGTVANTFTDAPTNAKYGMGFHKDHPKQKSFDPMAFDAAAYHTSYTTIQDDWIKLWGLFPALTNYTYISIGDFKAAGKSIAADGVVLFDLGTDACANQWLLESFDFTGTRTWSASTNVISGFNVGNPAPNGDVTVEPSGSITYKAGQMVDLKPGFSAKQGSYFHAYIEDCSSSPQHRFSSSDQEYTNSISACDAQEIVSQIPPEQGTTYEWSPSDNLSRTDVRNPVFTPPGTDPGYITYTITVTDADGGKATELLTVKYSGVDNNPSVRVNVTQADDYNPEYEVILGSNTEKLTAQVWDWSLSNMLYEEEMFVFDEINCCNLDYYMSSDYLGEYFCDNLKVKFISNNFCSTNEDVVTIDWEKSTTGPTIGTMPTTLNATAECYKVPFQGGMTYDIEVYNDGMELVYSQYNQEVFENPMCVWSGYDNDGQPLAEGIYYPHVWLKSVCTGTEVVTDATQSDGVELTWSSSKTGPLGLGDEKVHHKPESRIYPNPTNSSFVYESTSPAQYLIVEDVLGKRLLFKENIPAGKTAIDISNQPPGVYIIRVGGKEEGVYKIVKQ